MVMTLFGLECVKIQSRLSNLENVRLLFFFLDGRDLVEIKCCHINTLLNKADKMVLVQTDKTNLEWQIDDSISQLWFNSEKKMKTEKKLF